MTGDGGVAMPPLQERAIEARTAGNSAESRWSGRRVLAFANLAETRFMGTRFRPFAHGRERPCRHGLLGIFTIERFV